MSLILHVGAKAVGRDAIAALPTPAPLGPRHAPMPFIDLINNVVDNFSSIGATLKDEAFGLLRGPTGEPRRFFGLMTVDMPTHTDSTYSLEIGLRSSYDQSIAAALAVGSRVAVCDNLLISGEITFRTKNSTFVDKRIGRLIGITVQRIPEMAEAQSNFFERMKNTVISKREGDAMLIEMVRRGALTASQLATAIREWDSPQHDEHGEWGWTGWRLMNACTEAMKQPNSPNALGLTWQRSQILRSYLDEPANDQLPPPPDEILLAA
jgi:hypothetical protein